MEIQNNQIAITIEPNSYDRLTEWANSDPTKGKITLFGDAEVKNYGEVFLAAHGTPDGLIQMGECVWKPEDVLRGLIEGKLINNTIKTVYTISCYGGKQTSAIVDGIEIKSLHSSHTPIHLQLYHSIPVEECSTSKAICITLDYIAI